MYRRLFTDLFQQTTFLVTALHEIVSQQCNHLSTVKSDYEAKFNIIGLFPISNASSLHTTAVIWSEMMRYAITSFNKKHKRNLIGYVMYDAGGYSDISLTTEVVMNLMLGNSDTRLSDTTNKMCPCANKYKNNPLLSTLGIVGPSFSSHVTHMNKLLSYKRFPMISYGATSPELSNAEEYPDFFRTILTDTFQAKAFEDFLIALNWTYISIINSDENYGREGAYALTKFKSLCIFIQHSIQLPTKDAYIEPIMKELKQNVDSNVIILWGHSDLAKVIFNSAARYGVHNKIWILSESSGRNAWFVSKENKMQGTIIVIEPNGGRLDRFEDYFFNLTYKTSRHNPWVQLLFRKRGTNNSHNSEKKMREFKHIFRLQWTGYLYNAVMAYVNAFSQYANETIGCDIANLTCLPPPLTDHKHFSRHYIQNVNFKGLFNETISFDKNRDVNNGAFSFYVATKNRRELFTLAASWISDVGLLLEDKFSSLNLSAKKSRCSEICYRGFRPVFSAGVKKCCWKCVECEAGYVKPNRGLDLCTKCNGSHSSNRGRTKCVPFITSNLGYETDESYTTIVLSTIGLVITLVAIVTFIVARKTQIVRTVNIYPTILQLMVHLVLFLLPYLFLDDDTKPKCVARSFGAGILFSLIIGITLAKVTHITSLFKLKHRINKHELFQLKTIEFTIVIISLFIEVFLMIVLMQTEPIEMTVTRDHGTYNTVYHCHVIFHLSGQLVYIIFLQIICCVQAFRARNLPDLFNETKYITFAMFTSTLAMIFSIPLVSSYDNPIDKNFVISVAIMIANFLIVFVLYAYKVVIIWIYVKEHGIAGGDKKTLQLELAPKSRTSTVFESDAGDICR